MRFLELILKSPVFIPLVEQRIFEISGVLLPATGSTLPRARGICVFTCQSCKISYAHDEPPCCHLAAPKKATTRPAWRHETDVEPLGFILARL